MSNLAIANVWAQVALDPEIISMQNGFASPLNKAVTKGVLHLRPFNIGSNGELDLSKVIYISKDHEREIPLYKLQPGDILFNNTNSVELVGKSAIVRTSLDCTFSNHITRLRIRDTNQLDPAWLVLCLRVLWMDRFFAQQAHKWIGQAGFNPTDLAYVKIPLPDVGTQHQIVTRLEELLLELEELRKTLNGMRRDIGQVMESVLAEIFDESVTRNWPKRDLLGDLVTIRARQVDPRLPEYKSLPLIGGESIDSVTSRLGTYRTAEEDRALSSKYLFNPGAILYSKIRPYLRKATTVDFRGLCSADVYPLSVITEELLPRFLMWSLIAPPFTDFAKRKSSGRARIPKINRKELFSYELPFPNFNEQQYIVNYIDSIQTYLDMMQKSLEENNKLLQLVEQSILNQAFRGEL